MSCQCKTRQVVQLKIFSGFGSIENAAKACNEWVSQNGFEVIDIMVFESHDIVVTYIKEELAVIQAEDLGGIQ